MASDEATYLGFDLSTQQLKVLAISSSFSTILEESVTFDTDLPFYKTTKGVHTGPDDSVYAPVSMWLDALDLILSRMQQSNFDFSRVKGVCGAGQQHGSVYWNSQCEEILGRLNDKKGLKEQVESALSHPWSPNWQDHSTTAECEEFESAVGGKEELAKITGSKAHHRFTGPQIMRFRRKHPDAYASTSRISLVSSFLASIFLGRIAQIDISDVCGMNLWNIQSSTWNEQLLSLADGGTFSSSSNLQSRLGDVALDPSQPLGSISPYFTSKYGFNKECIVAPFTGDNPSTLLALPLSPGDVIVSLGTSTTLLMSTDVYASSSAYHMFTHPASSGLYMFMLCYKNGGLAREAVRDDINKIYSSTTSEGSWELFNNSAVNTPPLGKKSKEDKAKIGLYFPLPEIVPDVPNAGVYRFTHEASSSGVALHNSTSNEDNDGWDIPTSDARAICESQALSMRLRSAPLLPPTNPQPRRVYVVGGGSKNDAIVRVLADVIGATDGWYRLDIGGNACALGAAYKAVWTAEGDKESFEEFVRRRWKEEGKVEKLEGCGYRRGVWEEYGEILGAFEEAEGRVVKGV